MDIQVPIWFISRNWCVRQLKESDTRSLVLVPTQLGPPVVALFSTSESVDRFIKAEADGRTEFVGVSLQNLEALREFLEFLLRSGETHVVIDPGSEGLTLQFKVSQLIADLPSDEQQFQSTVYRSDYFQEWYEGNGG